MPFKQSLPSSESKLNCYIVTNSGTASSDVESEVQLRFSEQGLSESWNPPPQIREGEGPLVSPSQGAEAVLNLLSLASIHLLLFPKHILCQTTPIPNCSQFSCVPVFLCICGCRSV